jgi:hypothetical protein
VGLGGSALIEAVLMMAVPGSHVGNRCLGELEHRMDVDFDGQLPLLVGNILNGFEGHLLGGIIDEDVYATQLVYRHLDYLAAMAR